MTATLKSVDAHLTADAPATRRRPNRFRRAVLGLLGCLTVATGAFATSDSADAFAGGTVRFEVDCTRGRLGLHPEAVPEFTGGQYVAYRYRVEVPYTGAGVTGSWTGPVWARYTAGIATRLTNDYMTVPTGYRYRVYVQAAFYRWTGSAWTVRYSGMVEARYTGYTGTPITQCLT
jgi:hypothetical protein